MTVLVDSDILIEFSNSGTAVLYSPVSGAELWAGTRASEHDAIDNLFRAPTSIPIDEGCGASSASSIASITRSRTCHLSNKRVKSETGILFLPLMPLAV